MVFIFEPTTAVRAPPVFPGPGLGALVRRARMGFVGSVGQLRVDAACIRRRRLTHIPPKETAEKPEGRATLKLRGASL